MLVYHGTNADIAEIDLTKGIRFKDFGQGFYVTPDLETAQRMARKKVALFKGKPTVSSYEVDDRHTTPSPRSYDVVKGPIADDGVALQLSRLRLHADEAEQIALDLQDKYLDQQLCFRTQRSLTHLKKVSVCELK